MDKNVEIFISQQGDDYGIDIALEDHEDIDYLLAGVNLMNIDNLDAEIKNYLENPNDLDALYVGDVQININSYTHTQAIASATWNINHNLNKRDVIIGVFNQAHIGVMAEIENTDSNNSVIRFAFAVAGTAVCI